MTLKIGHLRLDSEQLYYIWDVHSKCMECKWRREAIQLMWLSPSTSLLPSSSFHIRNRSCIFLHRPSFSIPQSSNGRKMDHVHRPAYPTLDEGQGRHATCYDTRPRIGRSALPIFHSSAKNLWAFRSEKRRQENTFGPVQHDEGKKQGHTHANTKIWDGRDLRHSPETTVKSSTLRISRRPRFDVAYYL